MLPRPVPSPADVALALDGDRAAALRLARALAPTIQGRVARALLRRRGASGRDPRQEIEDLSQDVFAALFADGGKALRAWDPDRGLPLGPYVALITDREVASILRSGRRSPWTEDPTDEESLGRAMPEGDPRLEDVLASREMLSNLHVALQQRTSPLGLAVFHAVFVEERAPEEAAQKLGLTLDAVYAWRSRLGRLCRELASTVLRGADSGAT